MIKKLRTASLNSEFMVLIKKRSCLFSSHHM